MGCVLWSDVIKGARGAHLQARQEARPKATASVTVPPLDWEPSPSPAKLALPPCPPSHPPPLDSDFPTLDGDAVGDLVVLLPQTPLMNRSWAAITRGTNSPPKTSSVLSQKADDNAATNAATAEIPAPTVTPRTHLRDEQKEEVTLSPVMLHAKAMPLPSLAERGANAALWNAPIDADLIIRCPHPDGEARWNVHSHILIDMSEWMEKNMPPEAEDGSAVEWTLSWWDRGLLGAVLRYMYLEDFEGGVYDSNNPLSTDCVRVNVAHFLAGTSCLFRPMMDQAIDQIDEMTDKIKKLEPQLRCANLDTFHTPISQALIIMYDERDQWRIRALRIVMGKLLAVCFPLILQSPRWETYHQAGWGLLRARIVNDHKWLAQAGWLQKSNVVMKGFEHMEAVWVNYRNEGWQPSDDLMFPELACADPPLPQSTLADSKPLPAAGKKHSRAIPIIDPSLHVASVQGKPGPDDGAKGKGCSNDPVEPASAKETSLVKVKTIAEEAPCSITTASPACMHSALWTGSSFAGHTAMPGAYTRNDPNTVDGSAKWWANIFRQHRPFGPFLEPPFSSRPTPNGPRSWAPPPVRTQGPSDLDAQAAQRGPVLPCLPDGVFYFAENSKGKPASSHTSQTNDFAAMVLSGAPSTSNSVAASVIERSTSIGSAAPSVASGTSTTLSAEPSVVGESGASSAAGSSIDTSDSPASRMAELNMEDFGCDGSNDKISDCDLTPRASTYTQTKDHRVFDRGLTLRASPFAPATDHGNTDKRSSPSAAASPKDGKKTPHAPVLTQSSKSALAKQTLPGSAAGSQTPKHKKKQDKKKG